MCSLDVTFGLLLLQAELPGILGRFLFLRRLIATALLLLLPDFVLTLTILDLERFRDTFVSQRLSKGLASWGPYSFVLGFYLLVGLLLLHVVLLEVWRGRVSSLHMWTLWDHSKGGGPTDWVAFAPVELLRGSWLLGQLVLLSTRSCSLIVLACESVRSRPNLVRFADPSPAVLERKVAGLSYFRTRGGRNLECTEQLLSLHLFYFIVLPAR